MLDDDQIEYFRTAFGGDAGVKPPPAPEAAGSGTTKSASDTQAVAPVRQKPRGPATVVP